MTSDSPVAGIAGCAGRPGPTTCSRPWPGPRRTLPRWAACWAPRPPRCPTSCGPPGARGGAHVAAPAASRPDGRVARGDGRGTGAGGAAQPRRATVGLLRHGPTGWRWDRRRFRGAHGAAGRDAHGALRRPRAGEAVTAAAERLERLGLDRAATRSAPRDWEVALGRLPRGLDPQVEALLVRLAALHDALDLARVEEGAAVTAAEARARAAEVQAVLGQVEDVIAGVVGGLNAPPRRPPDGTRAPRRPPSATPERGSAGRAGTVRVALTCVPDTTFHATVVGVDRPGVTARMFGALADTTVLDVEQVVVAGQLVLGAVVLAPEGSEGQLAERHARRGAGLRGLRPAGARRGRLGDALQLHRHDRRPGDHRRRHQRAGRRPWPRAGRTSSGSTGSPTTP